MKKYSFVISLLLIFLLANNSFSQSINFGDGFEDGNFTDAPTWNGDADQFTVIDTNPNFLLQLQGDGDNGDISYLSTSSTGVKGSWEFFVDLDFNPSNNNRADFFLMSDIADLEGDVNGYAVRAGENLSNDVFRLVRYENGSEVETILSGTTDISSGGAFRVKVTRTTSGEWTLEVAEGYSGTLVQESGSKIDNTFSSANYFGVRASYTSSNAENFFFDFKIDLPPFRITNTIAEGDQVDLTFNRPYDQATVEKNNFSVNNGLNTPSSVTFTDATSIKLHYDNAIPSNRYILTVNNINDQNGKSIVDNTTSSFVIFDKYSEGDILINEFVYDPPDSFGKEYIELKNISGKFLNLQNWSIEDDGNSADISSDIVALEPGNFVVISSDTASLSGVFESRSYIQSSMPALNNGNDIIKIVTSEGATADSLSYTSDWGGNDVALERRSAETPSIFPENWSDSPNPDGGTPGTTNKVARDNTPPELVRLEINNAHNLQLTFDERLKTNTTLNAGNYILSGNATIRSADFLPPHKIKLSLADPLQNAEEYTLTVSGVEDIFSNVIANADTTLTYFEISPADSGEVFITEFNFAPPSGSTEYVEIHNPTSKSFNLQDWKLSDNRGIRATITGSQFIVPPGSFVVIAPDNTLQSEYPEITLLTMSSFPALNNSGDKIILRKENGTLLDSLQYFSEWGGDEIALERRTTSVSGTYQENWGNAPNDFGTPGTENEIAIDGTPPVFEELLIEEAATLTLIFSENIKSSSATDNQNYQIIPNRGIQLVSVQDNTITLFLDEDLNSGEIYEITASNISDIFGNTVSNTSKEVEFLRIDEVRHADIVINEILYNPDTGGGDFVELYNTSNKNFDLNNWIIGDSSNETSISQNIQLRAKSYLVLTGSSTLAQQNFKAFDISGFPALNNNTPDDIYLQTENKHTIDSLRYYQSWGGREDGTSLERKDPKAASNDGSNWQTSSDNGTSIGEQNISFQEDTQPPKVLFSKIQTNGNIEVRFNEFIRLTDDVTFLADGQTLQIAAFDSTNANFIVLQDTEAKQKDSNNTTITAENFSDIKGNTTPSSEISVAQPMQPGELVINEIMYNPLSEPDDNQPDQSEYIELRNTRDYPLSLEGLYLHDAPDEDGNLRDLHPITSTAKWVPPQGQVLIYADEALSFEKSQLANFFDIEPAQSRSLMRVDRTTLSLASSDDAIYIADSTDTVIDSVYFDDSWQNPNVIDTRGIALEQISPDGPSNDDSNWGSSVNPKGGTPHSENSIYQEQNEDPTEIGISFTPNPFTPDDDGNDDNLFINYKLEQQDYLMKVNIFDRYGRHVRELADGEQAGLKGQLMWDGRKDDQSRNRIGIYIVVFEAYDSSSGSDKAYKKTVVLARQLH